MLHVAVGALGFLLVLATVGASLRTFVLPRGERVLLTRLVFAITRVLFRLRLAGVDGYGTRDRIMAIYAPATLLILPIFFLALILVGYGGIYWAMGLRPVVHALAMSGSSLLTLGSERPEGIAMAIVVFSEAVIGLVMVAVQIAYLPSMYAAFSKREAMVTLLETRAGSPPSAVEMIERLHLLGRLDHLEELWRTWELWFVEIEESHTSLGALIFFRSHHPARSWVAAAGAVLDAAALVSSTLAIEATSSAELMLRTGSSALRRIAVHLRIPFDADPDPDRPPLLPREQFDRAFDAMAGAGVPLREDRDAAWKDFIDWRTNYEGVVTALAEWTMVPDAFWEDRTSSGSPGLWPRPERGARRSFFVRG